MHRQCKAKCRFAGTFDRLPGHSSRLLDRIPITWHYTAAPHIYYATDWSLSLGDCRYACLLGSLNCYTQCEQAASIAGFASCGALDGGLQRFQIQGENGTVHLEGGEALENALWSFPPGIPVAVTISDFPSARDGCSDFEVPLRIASLILWRSRT